MFVSYDPYSLLSIFIYSYISPLISQIFDGIDIHIQTGDKVNTYTYTYIYTRTHREHSYL